LQSLDERSIRQKELIQLVVVVILLGLISDIVASYLATYSFYGYSVGVWLVPILILLVLLAVYVILYPREVDEVAIYTNLMVDKKTNQMHLSPYSPFGVQYAELFWRALEQDKSPYANQILTQLHNSDSNELELDFIECVTFLILSGFEPLWASRKIGYYGYLTGYPSHLGEISRLADSTIYRIQKDEVESGDMLHFKKLEFRNLLPLLQNNQVVKHFLGETSLNRVHKPSNWLVFTPKGTQIAIEHKEHCRIIHFKHRYFTTSLTLVKNSVALGLPYGIKIREPDYDEKRYFSADFRMDFQASFSRLLLVCWGRTDYYNWVRLLRRKLVANFALDKAVFFKEID